MIFSFTRRRVILPVLALFALLGFPALWGAAETPEEQKARVERIEDAVLAPCCYTEPVSRHQSEIAVKMRLEIAKWVAAGKTDQEILDAYAAQYGRKVLVDPRTLPRLWMQWVPWLALLAGLVAGVGVLHRWRSRPALPPTTHGNPPTGVPRLDEEDWM